jgi:hypothetical protein
VDKLERGINDWFRVVVYTSSLYDRLYTCKAYDHFCGVHVLPRVAREGNVLFRASQCPQALSMLPNDTIASFQAQLCINMLSPVRHDLVLELLALSKCTLRVCRVTLYASGPVILSEHDAAYHRGQLQLSEPVSFVCDCMGQLATSSLLKQLCRD